jgi:hypothetical protein
VKYKTLAELKAAYESGAVPKDAPLVLDNDCSSVYVDDEQDLHPNELEDRHGDHWEPDYNGLWRRVEAPHEIRSADGLERDYGPLTREHTHRCIRRRTP